MTVPINWIFQNKEWLFSGIGVFILAFVITLVRESPAVKFKHKRNLQYSSKYENFFTGLHHVSLAVRNIKDSETFYSGFLKLKRVDRPGSDTFQFHGVWYALPDGRQLHLVENKKGTYRRHRLFRPGQPPDVHFALAIEDLQLYIYLREEAERLGILHVSEPFGLPQLYIIDPNNHIIEIYRSDSLRGNITNLKN